MAEQAPPPAVPDPVAGPALRSRNSRTAGLLCSVAVVVFGFGYALVPLYDVFCEWTGIRVNDETPARIAELPMVDASRWVAIEFDTNLRGGLPWEFRAELLKMEVRPGELREAIFIVRNTSARSIVGRAVPSIAPARAAPYFRKTECFCFVAQELAAGEERAMRVRFLVDSALPEQISTITLSYSFFAAPGQELAQLAAFRRARALAATSGLGARSLWPTHSY